MSGSFVSLYEDALSPVNADEGPFSTLIPRASALTALRESPVLDLVIVGGGCSGALIARDAALRGFRTLVLERGFFGDRAESWRGAFLDTLRHKPLGLVAAMPLLRGVSRRVLGDLADVSPCDSGLEPSVARSIGLRAVRGAWIAPSATKGGARVPDVDERALARELALAARQEGATVLANADAAFVERVSESEALRVGVRDQITGEVIEVTTRAVVANPRFGAPLVTRLGTPLVPTIVQETPVVLSVCTVIPTSVRAGAPLLSLELSDGSLAIVKKIGDGVVEVTLRFSGNVPEDGNVTDIIHQACQEAGWRISREVSRTRTGRRYSPDFSVGERKGVISFSERTPWEIESISRRVLKAVMAHLGEGSKQPRAIRALPGAERACEISAFRAIARGEGVSEATIETVVKRWRGRVRYLSKFNEGLREVAPGILKGEIDLALVSDQPASFEDLMVGSLDVRVLPEWQACVPRIAALLQQSSEIQADKESVERVYQWLSPPPSA